LFTVVTWQLSPIFTWSSVIQIAKIRLFSHPGQTTRECISSYVRKMASHHSICYIVKPHATGPRKLNSFIFSEQYLSVMSSKILHCGHENITFLLEIVLERLLVLFQAGTTSLCWGLGTVIVPEPDHAKHFR